MQTPQRSNVSSIIANEAECADRGTATQNNPVILTRFEHLKPMGPLEPLEHVERLERFDSNCCEEEVV
jgi:hypothetical protein